MQRAKVVLIFTLILLLLKGCAATRDSLISPPLKGVDPQMEYYCYWIEKLTTPQSELLSSEGINQRNLLLLERKDLYMHDLDGFPDHLGGEEIKEIIGISLDVLQKQLLSHLNYPMDQAKLVEILEHLGLDSIPPLKEVRWALTLRECSMRALPTNELGMGKPDDYQFNQIQLTRLDPGMALALIHSSPDGQWSFVVSYFCQGWIESENIAVAKDRETVLDFFEASPFVLYTGDSGYLYYDKGLTRFAVKVKMGTRLPLVEEAKDYLCVRMPVRDVKGCLSFTKGYVPKDSSVKIGYLPLTQESVARLAFGLKGSDYGWGGLFGGRDCSRFIFDVFRCLGLLLPRNSISQTQAGSALMDLTRFSNAQKERIVIEKGIPFATLLNLPGHVMLYIGKEGNKAYVIHSLWAYRESVFFRDRLRKVAQVAVSDLHLGEGSEKGSLLERLTSMTFLVDR